MKKLIVLLLFCNNCAAADGVDYLAKSQCAAFDGFVYNVQLLADDVSDSRITPATADQHFKQYLVALATAPDGMYPYDVPEAAAIARAIYRSIVKDGLNSARDESLQRQHIRARCMRDVSAANRVK